MVLWLQKWIADLGSEGRTAKWIFAMEREYESKQKGKKIYQSLTRLFVRQQLSNFSAEKEINEKTKCTGRETQAWNRESQDQILLAAMWRQKVQKEVCPRLKLRLRQMTEERFEEEWNDKLILGMKYKLWMHEWWSVQRHKNVEDDGKEHERRVFNLGERDEYFAWSEYQGHLICRRFSSASFLRYEKDSFLTVWLHFRFCFLLTSPVLDIIHLELQISPSSPLFLFKTASIHTLSPS